MKWMALLSVMLLAACGTIHTTEIVEYRQVVVEPVVERVVLEETRPVDVTVTEIDYY
ncbi:MAG: hypothetical protein JJT82_04515 [Legionellaceae bacterium]|nr:hypothetical protein [Legionellaceae bacterium]